MNKGLRWKLSLDKYNEAKGTKEAVFVFKIMWQNANPTSKESVDT